MIYHKGLLETPRDSGLNRGFLLIFEGRIRFGRVILAKEILD